MSNDSGLVFAFALDGKGGGRPLDFRGVRASREGNEKVWVHMDYTFESAREWLTRESGIDPIIVEALTAEETRPRSFVHNGGMLLVLRGVNLNPGADPEDMISVRLWIDATRIVTLRHRRVMAVEDLKNAVTSGDGPTGPGSFLEDLCDRLVARMGSVVSDVDDAVDALEDQVLVLQSRELRPKLATLRRTAIAMRRYLAPQRDVMARIFSEKVEWLGESERMRLREISDRTTRFVEDLDAIRDRALVTQEEINSRLAEQMNTTMYVLSIVASLFLPLGFLTGLLGINVGGIPGTGSKWAFSVFCLLLLAVAGIQMWVFKKKKWM
jgi:zinc transporter